MRYSMHQWGKSMGSVISPLVGDTVICYGDMKTAQELFDVAGLKDKS